jgi:hypothetical protein
MFNISNDLGNILQRKMQRMQQRDLLKLLSSNDQQQPTMNDTMSQGLNQGFSLSQSPSLKLADLLQGGQQSAVNRAVGKTPVRLPSFSQAPAAQQISPSPKAKEHIQQATAQAPINESAIEKKERLLREREELKKNLAIEKEEHKARLVREQEERGAAREDLEAKKKEQARVDADTLPYYREIKSQARSAKESQARVDRMLKLIHGGNLDSKYKVLIADSLDHLPFSLGKMWSSLIKSTYHPDTEEFEKISRDFLKGAKAYFGSRMTEQEAFAILQTVPNLLMTNLGKQRVARNMTILNDVTKLTNDAMEDIIKENGGRRPGDLERQVELRIGPKVDKLYEKFVSGEWDSRFYRK